MVEALSKVKRHRLWEQYGSPDNSWVSVYRAKNISPKEMKVIMAAAEEQVGKTYGYLKVVMHFLDWCLTGVYFFRWFARSENYPICSWLVASAFGEAGYDFGVPNEGANPDDIWDFVNERTDYYERIVLLGPLTRFAETDGAENLGSELHCSPSSDGARPPSPLCGRVGEACGDVSGR